MRMILAALPLALALAACDTLPGYPPGGGPYDPGGYPQPYPPQGPYQPQQPYPPQGGPMLSQTNWTVVAINGRPTPPRDFYLNFLPDRLVAKFGCNGLGAGYSVRGGLIYAGALVGTQMACPDMSFEEQGARILMQPMQARVMESYPERMVLSNAAGQIEAVRAR